MNILVDTNILFSVIVTPKGKIAAAIESIKNNHTVFISDFSFEELSKHKNRLIRLSNLSEIEIDKSIYFFEKNFNVVSSELLPNNIIIEAFELVKDIDVNDLPIVAASLLTKSILFTGDKKLHDALRLKNFKTVYNASELRELLQL
jgi:predicted nucleic acid-binding protein